MYTESMDSNEINVIGYIRVSTAEQGASGAGLQAQRQAIEREAKIRGWSLVRIFEDVGYSAKDLRRPGVQQALEVLDQGNADALAVAKLDRLSRSLLDFAGLIERTKRDRWALIALDIGLDTTTANGRMMAGLIAVIAEWERELIGQRTKDALAVRKSQGVTLGRRPLIPTVTGERITRLRQDGWTYRAIADLLTAEAIPTVQGGKRWYPSTVRSAIDRLTRTPTP